MGGYRVKAALTDHRRSRGRGTAACRCQVQPPSCRPGCPQWLDRSCPAIAGRRRNKFRQKQEVWDSIVSHRDLLTGNLPLFFFLYGKVAVIKRHYIQPSIPNSVIFTLLPFSSLFCLSEFFHIVLTLSVHAGLFRCFHSPPNSAMDYRIFNACQFL